MHPQEVTFTSEAAWTCAVWTCVAGLTGVTMTVAELVGVNGIGAFTTLFLLIAATLAMATIRQEMLSEAAAARGEAVGAPPVVSCHAAKAKVIEGIGFAGLTLLDAVTLSQPDGYQTATPVPVDAPTVPLIIRKDEALAA